jgi:DNA-binding response OmpR family regulator
VNLSQMKEHILVVEDEAGISRILQLELEHEGYTVGTAADGRTGYEMASTGDYQLVLLDVMLPEMSGIEVLRLLRQAGNPVPIILLTARDTVPDKVSGFVI